MKRNTPLTKPVDNCAWTLWETIGEYSVWCRQDQWDTIWNVTKGEMPSFYWGGYFDWAEMLKLKGIQ